MSISQSYRVVLLVFFELYILAVVEPSTTQKNVGKDYTMPQDFQNFILNIKSEVFKTKSGRKLNYMYTTEKSKQNKMKSAKLKRKDIKICSNGASCNIEKNNKDILKNALMMKLVSYYEDKYKLVDHEVPVPPFVRTTKGPTRTISRQYPEYNIEDDLAEVIVL